MQFFESVTAVFAVLTMLLGLVCGGYFALRAIKEMNVKESGGFSTVRRLEALYDKMRKSTGKCRVAYISVSLEKVRSLHSETHAQRMFYIIQPLLLRAFSSVGNDRIGIAPYDRKNFVAVGDISKEQVSRCLEAVNKKIVENKMLGAAEVKIGISDNPSDIPFSTAISRAKQVCSVAENGAFEEWKSSIGKSVEERISIENSIEEEIDNNRFFLEYQPVVRASDCEIVGAEVLSRLNSKDSGVLTPKSFLAAVASVGINEKFDYYIFEKNCKWISNDKEKRQRYKYTINFSRETLCSPDFPDRICEIVERYGIRYSTVAIEILENKALTDEEKAAVVRNLGVLKEKGTAVLLDDFGSGFTAINDLQHFAVDIVKIDRSIISKADSERGLAIFKSVVNTAKNLGLKTVCEGIETKEQLEIARKAGCDMLQGYYFSKPVPVARLEELQERNLPLPQGE